jgi:hypothetical protein
MQEPITLVPMVTDKIMRHVGYSKSREIFIALMMEVARTSETSVDIQLITRQYIPEVSELYIPKIIHSQFSLQK